MRYNLLKSYWGLKANYVEYDFPGNTLKASTPKNLALEYNKNGPYAPKKRICYAPFNNMHFTLNGKVSACFFYFSHFIGDINKQTIREIWFGRDYYD